MVLGPCHDDMAPEREDVSEGKGGVPMRLGLRIVDEQCQPVTDANLDIWHCDSVGVYSSEPTTPSDFVRMITQIPWKPGGFAGIK